MSGCFWTRTYMQLVTTLQIALGTNTNTRNDYKNLTVINYVHEL